MAELDELVLSDELVPVLEFEFSAEAVDVIVANAVDVIVAVAVSVAVAV